MEDKTEAVDGVLDVAIWRGKADGGYARYTVPRRASQTVLDVVTYVQRSLDPSLSYRFACRVGMCGSCAMTVNGRPRWTCRTHVGNVVGGDDRLEVGPLANLPIIRDLVVDMAGFFEKWQAASGVFHPSATRQDPLPPIAPDSPERREADQAIECINCAVCYAACDTVAWNPDYLGPAALNRAWTLVNDRRDADTLTLRPMRGKGEPGRSGTSVRIASVSGKGGCQVCHTHQSCQQHCPVGLNPTRSIAGLKRYSVRAYLRGGQTS